MSSYRRSRPTKHGHWIVREVIPGRDEGEMGIDWEQHYSKNRGMRCLRTSYWTRDGINTRTGGPGFRGNYAG